MDKGLHISPADSGILLEALAAASPGADIEVLGEGLGASQGAWPLEKCARQSLGRLFPGADVCILHQNRLAGKVAMSGHVQPWQTSAAQGSLQRLC